MYQRAGSDADRWDTDIAYWRRHHDEALLWWEGAQNAVENILNARMDIHTLPDAESPAAERQSAVAIHRGLLSPIDTARASRQPHGGPVERTRQALCVYQEMYGMYQERFGWHEQQLHFLGEHAKAQKI